MYQQENEVRLYSLEKELLLNQAFRTRPGNYEFLISKLS